MRDKSWILAGYLEGNVDSAMNEKYRNTECTSDLCEKQTFTQ